MAYQESPPREHCTLMQILKEPLQKFPFSQPLFMKRGFACIEYALHAHKVTNPRGHTWPIHPREPPRSSPSSYANDATWPNVTFRAGLIGRVRAGAGATLWTLPLCSLANRYTFLLLGTTPALFCYYD